MILKKWKASHVFSTCEQMSVGPSSFSVRVFVSFSSNYAVQPQFALYSRETARRSGKYSASQAMEHYSCRIWGMFDFKQIEGQIFLQQNGLIWEQNRMAGPEKQRRRTLFYGLGKGYP